MGGCPHTFSSYPPFQPWVDVLSFLLPFLVPFCIGIHERHPFLDWILIVLFLYLCHWNLVYALCLCLCFVFVVLPLPSFFFVVVVVVVVPLLLSVMVWVLLSYYSTKIATRNKGKWRRRTLYKTVISAIMGSWEGEITFWWNSQCDILWLKTAWKEMLSLHWFHDWRCWLFIRSSICPFYSTNGELDSIGLRTWPCMVRHNQAISTRSSTSTTGGRSQKEVADLDCYIPNTHRLQDCKSQNCLHFTFKHACVCWFAASTILLGKLVQSLVPLFESYWY